MPTNILPRNIAMKLQIIKNLFESYNIPVHINRYYDFATNKNIVIFHHKNECKGTLEVLAKYEESLGELTLIETTCPEILL